MALGYRIQRESMSVGFVNHVKLYQFSYAMCQTFGESCCYQVGSSTQTKDWRDVDVVMILDDDKFSKIFPMDGNGIDMKWMILCAACSFYGKEVTGLPIDFKLQSQCQANERYSKKPRMAIGLNAANRDIPISFYHASPHGKVLWHKDDENRVFVDSKGDYELFESDEEEPKIVFVAHGEVSETSHNLTIDEAKQLRDELHFLILNHSKVLGKEFMV